MSENKENCNLLLLSTDLEWSGAFLKGVQRFYVTTERIIDSVGKLKTELQALLPDLIIVSVNEEFTPDKVKLILNELGLIIPIIAIDLNPQPALDNLIKLGADYAVARRDLLSALKYLQNIMYVKQVSAISEETRRKSHSLQGRFSRLYEDLPDPVAYVQDGLFVDCNPAFLNTFGLAHRGQLDETTLMTFVPGKSERALKNFLRKAADKDVIPAEKMEFQKLNGEPVEVMLGLANVDFDGEKALQLHFRLGGGTASAGGGGGGIDMTTRLPAPAVLRANLAQAQERAEEGAVLGYWMHLLIENYREIWQRDGYKPAEIMMKAVAEASQRYLPPSTEIVRFTDDALVMWISGEKEEAIKRVQGLITRLDEVVPENIGRLVTPVTFAGMYEIKQDTSYEELVSKGYRAVMALIMGNTGERVAEPVSGNMSRKDEKRVNQIKEIMDEGRIQLLYQPIPTMDTDGVVRYADAINFLDKEGEEAGPDELVDYDIIMQIGERYNLAKQFDYFKVSKLTEDVLSYGGDQKALNFYLTFSNSALNDEAFPAWLESQLQQTGLNPAQIVIEFSTDAYNNAYSGAKRLVDRLRPLGTRFALSELARWDNEIEDMLKRLRPEVLVLDMRELDTFEENEEDSFFRELKNYAREHKCEIVVNHMDSPAQLSMVWRNDLNILQGDGIVKPIEGFNYDFNEPLF